MTDLYKEIGRQIRLLRSKYSDGNLSQEALAQKLKVAPNTVSRWETGTYKPTPEDLDNLARFFGVSITIFFPDKKANVTQVAALTSAIGGLNQRDINEIIRYAEFRKIRQAMKPEKKRKKSENAN